MKCVHDAYVSDEVAVALGEGGRKVSVLVYEVPNGFVFTYGGCFDNHDLYGRADGAEPYATLADALAAAEDVEDEDGRGGDGAGADVGEFTGALPSY